MRLWRRNDSGGGPDICRGGFGVGRRQSFLLSFPSPPCGIPTYRIFRSGRALSGNLMFPLPGFPIETFGNDMGWWCRHLSRRLPFRTQFLLYHCHSDQTSHAQGVMSAWRNLVRTTTKPTFHEPYRRFLLAKNARPNDMWWWSRHLSRRIWRRKADSLSYCHSRHRLAGSRHIGYFGRDALLAGI